MLIDRNTHSLEMDVIILTAIKEIMLARISKDIIYSIEKKLKKEKEELLKEFD